MAKLKLSLSRRLPENLVALAKHVLSRVAPAAPDVPPVPGVADEAAEPQIACDEAEAANTAYANALTALETCRLVRAQKGEALRRAHDVMASALVTKSKGAPGPLTETGYDLAVPSIRSKEPPTKPENLVVTAGEYDRTLDAACDPVAKARSYAWEVTTADPVAGPYVPTSPTTASRTTLKELTSGIRFWVRVAAVGAKGIGPWSAPASKIVP